MIGDGGNEMNSASARVAAGLWPALFVLLLATPVRPGEGAEANDPPAAAAEAAVKPPAADKRHPVPGEDAQAEILRTLRELFKKEIENKLPHARRALAAHLIVKAREANDKPAEQYVMFRVARDLAVQQGDSTLGLLAADELAKRFDVAGPQGKADVLSRTLRVAKTPAEIVVAADSILNEAEVETDDASYEAMAPLVRQLEVTLLKKCGPEMGRLLNQKRGRLDERVELASQARAASATLAGNPDDPAANLALGRFLCLAKGDWDKGLPLLAKGNAGALSRAAGQVATNMHDTLGQVALADAWWALAEKGRRDSAAQTTLYAAARHYYEAALPRLAGADLARVRQRIDRIYFGPAERGHRPLEVPLGGLAGLPSMLPKKFNGKIAPHEGYAAFQGKCRVDYEALPISSYVHEFELSFAAPQGSLELVYGEGYQGAKVNFSWDGKKKKFVCKVFRYSGNWFFWGGERLYDPGQTLKFTFYVNENLQRLFEGDTRVLGSNARPCDLFFRFHTGDDTAVAISRCRFRPWTQVDADRLKQAMPPGIVRSERAESALRFHERNLGLKDKPALAAPKPFVVATTCTPMQWVPAGSFRTVSGKDQAMATDVTLSYGFWIGRYEITQGEWMTLAPTNPSRVFGSMLLPVDAASYEDAATFCMLLNRQESRARRVPQGYVYRLPTEAEWEYACRAGGKEDFSVEPDGLWSAETSAWRPHDVGEGKASAWGLYDMHGNVAEWCLDAWRDIPEKPPVRVIDPFVAPKTDEPFFPLRGGAWWQGHDGCSCRAREQSKSVPGGYRGFRIVLAPVRRG